jgi:hypothetical protein
MNKEKADAVAHAITQLLLESELSEAESVYALAVGATMRIAFDCSTIKELEEKVPHLTKIFSLILPANLEAFKLAIEAKQRENKDAF